MSDLYLLDVDMSSCVISCLQITSLSYNCGLNASDASDFVANCHTDIEQLIFNPSRTGPTVT